MSLQNLVVDGAVALGLLFVASGAANAAEYELESCQFIAESSSSGQNAVPPGLDEPLNCDHKCFYDELGLDLLGSKKPTLHDMYSIGWRLVDIESVQFDGQQIWTVYLERPSNGQKNECDRTYAPKQPDDESTQGSS